MNGGGLPQCGLVELHCGGWRGERGGGGEVRMKVGVEREGENEELPFASLTSLNRNKA